MPQHPTSRRFDSERHPIRPNGTGRTGDPYDPRSFDPAIRPHLLALTRTMAVLSESQRIAFARRLIDRLGVALLAVGIEWDDINPACDPSLFTQAPTD